MRAAALVLLGGCAGVTADPGLVADVRIANAQFFAGPMPAATSAAAVTAIDSLNNTIWRGQIGKSLSGRLTGDGRAVAIGFADDPSGYWVVPAGAADLNSPDQLTWSAKAAFSDDLTTGEHVLDVSAIDGSGAFGAPAALDLAVRDRQLDLADTKLAVSLRWDTEADLDLHLALPGDPAVIVWTGNLNSYIPPAPGEPVDPDAVAAGGILDFDSNSQCLIDGRREENIVWRGAKAMPPHGTYAVRVDTFSLCAAATAHWRLDVFVGGDPTPIAHAEGTVTDGDTRGDHVAASGIHALDFSL